MKSLLGIQGQGALDAVARGRLPVVFGFDGTHFDGLERALRRGARGRVRVGGRRRGAARPETGAAPPQRPRR